MAKKARKVKGQTQRASAKAPKPRLVAKRAEKIQHTRTAASANAAVQPAPEPAVLRSLGPILLPEPDDAVRVLKELAELNDRAATLKARYEEFRDATKNAKEKYDDAAELVLTRLRVTTHKSDLPLFQEEREADQAQMETAARVQIAQDAINKLAGEPSGDDQGQGEGELRLTLGEAPASFSEVTGTFCPADDAPVGIPDEDIPF